MKSISQLRFNALAGFARDPRALAYAEELGWFEHADGRVLGLLIRDRADQDFAGIVFARDELLQYRWTNMTTFEKSPRWAEAKLRSALEQAAMAPDEEHHQGHKKKTPVDFFSPVVPSDRLDPDFLGLIEQEGFSPARGIIEPMMRWHDDVDGNFVEQFQTTGFDARLWELYLFASLTELGFAIDRSEAAPDFVAQSLRGEVAIEAVTVNPTKDKSGTALPPPPVDTEDQRIAYLKEYMPIKFGSALYSKLGKEYWAREHVRGKPFVLAVQDFSSPGSMIFTRTGLEIYLYGYDHDWSHDENGKLMIRPRRVTSHTWESKVIPSGFFFLPGSENVSAVLFSNSGTISKFNRTGMLAGFGSGRVEMIRQGFAYKHDDNSAAPEPFSKIVAASDYSEDWAEGLEVFHNPRALVPLDPSLFPRASHIRLQDDGQIVAMVPEWCPLGSRTLIRVRGETAA
jgi:hypothetical protein